MQHLSYPPPERVARNQRANRAGVPMFYASATWHPPFFEAGVQPNDEILLSRWISRQPRRLVSLGGRTGVTATDAVFSYGP